MKEHQKKAFDFAAETTKQLITISTAIITLSITFSKDILGGAENSPRLLLITTWGFFIVSIVSGVITFMALTGTLQSLKKKIIVIREEENNEIVEGNIQDECENISINNSNIRLFSLIQAISFVIGIIMTGIFGYMSLCNQQKDDTKEQDYYKVVRHSTLNNDLSKVYIDTLEIPK